MHFDRYRWQDHVPSPGRWKVDFLIVSCFAALLVGFGVERMHQGDDGIRKVALLVYDPVAPAHAAVVARSLPVGQPALGVVGHGLDFVLNFDADEPLSSFAALPDALAAFSKSNVDKDAKKAKEEKDEQRPEEKKDKSSDLQKIVAGYNEYLAPVVKAQKDLFADTTMKKEELQAELAKELEKLKEADEGYQALTQKIGALLAGREQLAARIEAASNALLEAATGISEHWSQIAELTTGVSTSGALVLSHRAEMALDALRRKASRRLQKYPYALSRAYEYRMLRPYAGDLTLHRLFEQMRVLIVGSGNGLLDSKASDMLYGLYREEVAAIVEEVADDYNAGAAVHTASVRYELSSEELARLNAGERVELDFWERGAFKSSDEDVRIVGLAFVPSELQVEQTGSSSFSYLDLVTEHGGMSRIWRDGKVRAFQHHSSRSPQPLRWTTRWEAGNVTQHQPAASSESLLRALLPDAAVDIMLFSNRSAWAVLSLRKEAHAGPSVDFMIRRACLELRYDYRPSTGQQWSLYRDQQHMAIQRLYEQLLQRSANERELREARAMLDIGYDDAELRSFVLQTHHEERLGVEVDALYAALARPAPTAHERAFWMNELSSSRPSQQVSAYVQAIAAQFGQPASFDELAQWVELLDSGAAPAKRQALRGAAE